MGNIQKECAENAIIYLCRCLCKYNKGQENCENCELEAVKVRITEMPDEEPVMKTGEWVRTIHDKIICNQCGYMPKTGLELICPKCGAMMETET